MMYARNMLRMLWQKYACNEIDVRASINGITNA